MRDPYEVLGVPKTASEAEIKKAFRSLAKKHHPDKHAGDAAAQKKFQEISAAYDILGDKDKRAQFDAGAIGNDGNPKAGPFGAGGGFDPARDIEAITVNRWPHGYAPEYNPLFDPDGPENLRPNVIGRAPFGRIAIANSDAGGAAYTDSAIAQADRAVNELLRG